MARTPQELEDTVTTKLQQKISLTVADLITVVNGHPDGDVLVEKFTALNPGVVNDMSKRLEAVAKTKARAQAQIILGKPNITHNELDSIL